jgi:hypothetical protein
MHELLRSQRDEGVPVQEMRLHQPAPEVQRKQEGLGLQPNPFNITPFSKPDFCGHIFLKRASIIVQ